MAEPSTPDLLAGHRRMRACLLAIRHLDPTGVATRLVEFDREIARLEALLGQPAAPAQRIEFVSIGAEPLLRLTAA